MLVLQGMSVAGDVGVALGEATAGWGHPSPDIIFVFASTKQDPAAVARGLGERFPGVLVVGCTTTGEHLSGEHYNGALVLTALCDSGIRWSTAVVRDIAGLDEARAGQVVSELFRGLDVNTEDFEPAEHFCMLFIDGLRGCEEVFSALIAEALEGVKLVGGSAGDDLAFRETRIIAGGEALTDAAVLVMGHGAGKFEIFKHQHFTTTPRRLVVTKVSRGGRRVCELDGRRALDAYASALGIATEQVTDDVTFMNPVTFSCQGEIYVRSIQRLDPDGTIDFYCGVEEGMVLEIGGHHSITEALQADVTKITARSGPLDFMLGYNCILRALEADKEGLVGELGQLWRAASKTSIGFDTYGEQLDGLHINQTLVAIGFRDDASGRPA
ncbi:FIST N-terminal domain-containing protein [soil metagenome]